MNYTTDLLEVFISICEKFSLPFVITGTWLKKEKSIHAHWVGWGERGKSDLTIQLKLSGEKMSVLTAH